MASRDYIYLTYDLETTGLDPELHAVCEIAMCAFDNNLNDISEYESGVISPYGERVITDKALERNSITKKQLEEGRSSKDVIKEVISFIKSLQKSKSKIILCGHNIIDFDNPHLFNFFSTHKKDANSYVNCEYFIDTLFWGGIKHVESENYQLHTMCSKEDITLINAHRALSDARANKELVKSYIRNLRGSGFIAEKIESARINFEF